MFGNTYVCESTFSTMKQGRSTNRNRMADETLNDTTNTGINKGTILSGKPRPQASHRWRFVVNCYVLVGNNFYDKLTYLSFFSFICFVRVLYIIYWNWSSSCHNFVKWLIVQN